MTLVKVSTQQRILLAQSYCWNYPLSLAAVILGVLHLSACLSLSKYNAVFGAATDQISDIDIVIAASKRRNPDIFSVDEVCNFRGEVMPKSISLHPKNLTQKTTNCH